jgi:hypothetical protein
VDSIAKFLRDLECVPKYASCMLFDINRSLLLCNAFLKERSMYKASLLSPVKGLVVARMLPLILDMQFNNACSDNKKRYILCFFLFLNANGVSCEVYVNFMLVGHTHDNIGRWRKKLKRNDYSMLPLLIKLFMDAET